MKEDNVESEIEGEEREKERGTQRAQKLVVDREGGHRKAMSEV